MYKRIGHGHCRNPGTRERGRLERTQEIVERVKRGETALYEILMRRYNQRLYRVALAILRNDAEAEDVMQDAYVRAYQHLDQFAERAPFSAWLTRIAVNEALDECGQRSRNEELESRPWEVLYEDGGRSRSGAERVAFEHGGLLEAAVLGLPEQYRTVVMFRDVEELSTSETAMRSNCRRKT